MRFVRWYHPLVLLEVMIGVLNPLGLPQIFEEELVHFHQMMKLSAKGLAYVHSTPFVILWTLMWISVSVTQIKLLFKMLMLCLRLSELSLMTEYTIAFRISMHSDLYQCIQIYINAFRMFRNSDLYQCIQDV